MSKKNKRDTIIIVVVVVAIIGWIVAFRVNERRQQQKKLENETYQMQQRDALTHDIETVVKYQSEYMGDASNDRNIFNNLPLNDVPTLFALDSEKRIITVYYQGVDWNIGIEKVKRNLVYNSTAAFALINNLDGITYEFCGNQYKYKRTQVEKVFGKDLRKLLEKKEWKKKVQDKLEDQSFVEQFYN